MSTIDSIVRELEKIPEPMQLSILDFVRSIASTPTREGMADDRKVNGERHYPLRSLPIQLPPDFDEPMTDLWAALGE